MRAAAALALLLLTACASRPPDLSRRTGVVELPAGTIVLHHELEVAGGAHDLEVRGAPAGTTLRAAPDFDGRALIYANRAHGLRLTGFRIEGSRNALAQPVGLPPSDVPFARFYRHNGILIEDSERVTIRGVAFAEVANYPIIVSRSAGVRIESVRIDDSGSLSPAGRNNASGGILLEEGTRDFEVRQCIVRRARGNAIWTHSNYHSPRNADGVIAGNSIEETARDAIQVGHATNVRVENNTGARIGYPIPLVDMLSYAVPVALDTGGNVDRSTYADNRFTDVNGQCIDLDGFHDGDVRGNSCVSHGSYDDYPYAQFGIVFGDSNPDMQPDHVTVAGNRIDGAGFGGLYLIGSGNVVTGNRFLGLNRNRCTGDMTQARCNYAADQPDLLRSGIYLAAGAARPAPASHNQITENEISGFGMNRWCIAAAPGVSASANRIAKNQCTDTGAGVRTARRRQ
ncbi:MAG TPA: right-handed parallel beta-helix repeat-containing protein [Bryobacteraceae bacterium]|nr:right-handed parallel beta-helix repeat-containing protein [Bryobacteraceae bacterium]